MKKYRAADPATLRIVPLDILTAIHHRPSGQTHLVESPVPEILDALQAGATTVERLMSTLSARYDLADPDSDALTARLEELAAAGLVARA